MQLGDALGQVRRRFVLITMVASAKVGVCWKKVQVEVEALSECASDINCNVRYMLRRANSQILLSIHQQTPQSFADLQCFGNVIAMFNSVPPYEYNML